MLAILLNPLTNFLVKKGHFPHVVSISVAVLVAMLILIGIGLLLVMEVRGFSDQLPIFQKKLAEMGSKAQAFMQQHLGMDRNQQQQYLHEGKTALKPLLAATASSALGGFAGFVLLPIYTFLFLFYKALLLNFLYEVFAEENESSVRKILTETKSAIQQYMFGLLLEAIIVATLNSVALLILGVKYAVLLGVMGALLNVIPFIGGILAVLIPVVIATLTQSGIHTQVAICIAYAIIQFTDNHFLIPYVVSSKVKINALVSIIIVFLGGSLWGVSGMFLSIPFTGVLKIIFDRVPDLKPWGKLLGTEVPTQHKGQFRQISRRIGKSLSGKKN
ncbi:permease PerM [Filimonas lacunae]|nr:permease PerM [Filimonas lacunae]